MPGSGRALFPNPLLYGLLTISIVTNLIFVGRQATIDWHAFVHEDQPVPAVTAAEHIRGDSAASITVVEYADFECAFCARFHEVLKTAVGENTRVRWVYRHLPLSDIHPRAVAAAEAAECASDQGRFWEYADLLFERPRQRDDAHLTAMARDLDLDEARFTACRQSGSKRARVAYDATAFPEGHLAGTPMSFINGKRLEGAVPLEDVRRAIAAAH